MLQVAVCPSHCPSILDKSSLEKGAATTKLCKPGRAWVMSNKYPSDKPASPSKYHKFSQDLSLGQSGSSCIYQRDNCQRWAAPGARLCQCMTVVRCGREVSSASKALETCCRVQGAQVTRREGGTCQTGQQLFSPRCLSHLWAALRPQPPPEQQLHRSVCLFPSFLLPS